MADESPFETISKFQVSPPVNVDGIAVALGLKVTRMDLGAAISGSIMRDRRLAGPSGFAILINNKDAPVRQRFTLAHEIAHYILHRDLIETGITDDPQYRSHELGSFYETEANKLAADILMPVRLVKKTAQTISSLSELARTFQVSSEAMRIKLSNMGITVSS